MNSSARNRYVRQILDRYRATPGTRGRTRPADRRLAEELFRRAIPLETVCAALVLTAARRTFRDPDLGPLEPIGSLHYFLPVLDEIQRQPLEPSYVQYLEDKLDTIDSSTEQIHRFT